MVWEAFCSTTKSDLVFIPRKAKVDAVTYIETVLEPYLVPVWHKCCEEYGSTNVIEDGALGYQVWFHLDFSSLFIAYFVLG